LSAARRELNINDRICGYVYGWLAVEAGGGAAVISTYYTPDLSSGDIFSKNKAAADPTTNDTYIKP
jgi:hypothetical protein